MNYSLMDINERTIVLSSLEEKLGYNYSSDELLNSEFGLYFNEEEFIIDYLKIAPAKSGLLRSVIRNEKLTKPILLQVLALVDEYLKAVFDGKCSCYDVTLNRYLHDAKCRGLPTLKEWSALDQEIIEIWLQSPLEVKSDRDVCLKLLGYFHYRTFYEEIHGEIMKWFGKDASFFLDLYEYYPDVAMFNVLFEKGVLSENLRNDVFFYLKILKIANSTSSGCLFPLKQFMYSDGNLQKDSRALTEILNYSPFPYFYLSPQIQMKTEVLNCMSNHLDLLKRKIEEVGQWEIWDCPDEGFVGQNAQDKIREVIVRIESNNLRT